MFYGFFVGTAFALIKYTLVNFSFYRYSFLELKVWQLAMVWNMAEDRHNENRGDSFQKGYYLKYKFKLERILKCPQGNIKTERSVLVPVELKVEQKGTDPGALGQEATVLVVG